MNTVENLSSSPFGDAVTVDIGRVKELLAKYPGVWKAAVDTVDDSHWGPMEAVTFTSPDGQQTYVAGTGSLERFELAAAAINLLPVLLRVAEAADGREGLWAGGERPERGDCLNVRDELSAAVRVWRQVRDEPC